MNGEVIDIADEPTHSRSARAQKQTGPVSKSYVDSLSGKDPTDNGYPLDTCKKISMKTYVVGS